MQAMSHTQSIEARRAARRRKYRIRREAFQNAPDPGNDQALKQEISAQTAEMERLTQMLTLSQEQCLRARSDLENFRKRANREREENRKFAIEGFVRGLLETVDNLERAILGAEQSQDIKALHEGVAMIHQQFVINLQRQGVETIDANPGTPFDPARHEAVAIESNDAYENDTIVACFQAGYILNGRVLRAAKVKVSKK